MPRFGRRFCLFSFRFYSYELAVPIAPTPADPLTMPVARLRGVGPERAAQLERLELRTVGDLLLHRPRRHEDRSQFRPIAELQEGEASLTRGRIVAQGVKRFARGRTSVFELIIDDGSARLHCRWWNLPFMERYFAVGDDVLVFGKPLSLRPRTMDHPETEVVVNDAESQLHLNRIVPVYSLTEGVPQRWLRGLLARVVKDFAPHVIEPQPAPSGSPSRAEALRMIHFPEQADEIETARRRLALDEFIALQLAIQKRRRAWESRATSLPCAGTNHLMRPFLERLTFKLTDAQTKVLREIRADLGARHPMRRLLQGDVGAGKTVVAACAALMAIESGRTVALMDPTEILAEQHFKTFCHWLEPLGIEVHLLTGSRKTGGSKKTADDDSKHSRSPALFIGTHALLEENFAPENLGLVIIDEQHKFGVAQRERLLRKGRYPHLLVMTATPIPRTLGLTLYGDLDVSVIDQLPAGRGRLRTHVRTADTLPKVIEFIRKQLAQGRQTYVVYPRVNDEKLAEGVKAVTAETEKLRVALAPFRVGALHGRMKSAEKESVMAAFHANELHVLVATTVIEVGVDVANATVMLIENAEQFGLAQLHQLRGRIGRGTHDSHCILLSNADTPESRERLKVLAETNDGFKVAEADLMLRGPGELLGRDQSGLPNLIFGDLARDLALLEQARTLAAKSLIAPPPI